MPPKNKFTPEEIVAAALELVRCQGMDALTARALASQLGVSVKPIFGLFSGMEEVRQQVIFQADSLYQSYLAADMASGQYPPYKASGMAYIRFARQEQALFKLLFMRDRTGETSREDPSIEPILEIIQKSQNISREQALLFHLEMWVYVHGIATMVATGYLDWDEDFTSRCLTDAYQGLSARFREEKPCMR